MLKRQGESSTKTNHVVYIYEFERNWGSKVDEVVYFDTEENARKFVEDFNSSNTEDVVPDWYMTAEYICN